MVEARTRRLAVVVGRDGIVYPGIVAGVAYLASTMLAVTFGTVLFAVFAVAAVTTGFGAMRGSASNDTLQAGAGLTGTVTPGERADTATLLRLGLFDLGVAVVLSVHALWWAGTG